MNGSKHLQKKGAGKQAGIKETWLEGRVSQHANTGQKTAQWAGVCQLVPLQALERTSPAIGHKCKNLSYLQAPCNGQLPIPVVLRAGRAE